MAWTIEIAHSALKQLKKIDRAEAKRISDYLKKRVAPLEDPRSLGKPLNGNLSDLWSYRIGNYRTICELKDDTLVVLVVRVGHRKAVYK